MRGEADTVEIEFPRLCHTDVVECGSKTYISFWVFSTGRFLLPFIVFCKLSQVSASMYYRQTVNLKLKTY